MPNYDHACYECEYEWEDTYSIKMDPPTVCPKCSGKARRVILQVPAGTVKLEGAELKQHITDERKKIRHQLKSDEKLKANLMGEEKFHNTETNVKKIGEELRQRFD
jgi:putative FmdB family regulatory protein